MGKVQRTRAPNFGRLQIIEALPHALYAPEGGEALLQEMAGASIVRIGSTDEDGIEGGGLLIDYSLPHSAEIKRVVFAFNDGGLWINWTGLLA
jgi:hypothetical protein